MNKKGFVLAEAIVVAVFVLGMFTYLAINIFPLITKYDQAINYDNPNEVYLANVLYEEILQTGKIDDLEEGMYSFKVDEENNNIDVDYTSPDGTKTEDISSLNSKFFQTDYYKNLIHNELRIKNIVVLKADAGDRVDETAQSILSTKSGLTRGMRNYYNYLKGRKEFSAKRFSILVEFASGKYASVSLKDYIYCFLTDDTDDSKLKVIGWESACGPVPSELEIPNELYLNNDEDGSKFLESKKTVITIASSAFQNKNIKSLILPHSIETIGRNAFYNNQISKISYENENGKVDDSLPPSLEKIDSYAFVNNQITGELKLNDNLKEIGYQAFFIEDNNKNSEQKLTLVVPETVSTIGSNAFVGNNFEKLTIGKCNYNICGGNNNGNYVFGNSIKNLVIDGGVIYSKAFYNAGIETVYLKEGVDVDTNTEAFYGNSDIEVTIEKCTELICTGGMNFSNAPFSSIKTLIINKGEIGSNGFLEKEIQTLTLGEEVSSIGTRAFANNQIRHLDLSKTGVNEVGDIAFSSNLINSLTLSTNIWKIGNSAFSNNEIEQLDLSNVTYLGNKAFASNPIKNLKLSESLTTIPSYAFNNGDFIWDNNNTIYEFTLPASVTTIGDNAFWGNKFESLTIENCTLDICKYQNGGGVRSGGNKNFGSFIDKLKIGAGQVGIMAFYGVGLTTLTIGEGVTSIGEHAFNNPIDPSGSLTMSTLKELIIERDETDFLKNVTLGANWLDRRSNPTITCAGVTCDLS